MSKLTVFDPCSRDTLFALYGDEIVAEHLCHPHWQIRRHETANSEPHWTMRSVGRGIWADITVCPFCGCKLEREYQYQRAFGG